MEINAVTQAKNEALLQKLRFDCKYTKPLLFRLLMKFSANKSNSIKIYLLVSEIYM